MSAYITHIQKSLIFISVNLTHSGPGRKIKFCVYFHPVCRVCWLFHFLWEKSRLKCWVLPGALIVHFYNIVPPPNMGWREVEPYLNTQTVISRYLVKPSCMLNRLSPLCAACGVLQIMYKVNCCSSMFMLHLHSNILSDRNDKIYRGTHETLSHFG